jgi:small-conductance mechanosensitive channel
MYLTVKTDWISLVGLIVIPVFLMLFVLFNGFEMLMAKNKDERQKWLKELPKRLWMTAVLVLLFAGAILSYYGHTFLGLGLLLAGVALAWIHWWWPKLIKLLMMMIKAAQACDNQFHGKD